MVVVRLQGGLGNQMFQYAAAYSLAKRHGQKPLIDTSWYREADQSDGVGVREYELSPLLIDERFYKRNLLTRIINELQPPAVYTDEDEPYVYDRKFRKLPRNTVLFGYFQNEKYFLHDREDILQIFTMKDTPSEQNATLLRQITQSDRSVSVHVRRGDYVSSQKHNAMHGTKSIDYYRTATSCIEEKIKKPELYVFSDDPEWCKKNLKLKHAVVYVDHNTYGGDDMRLMRACRHNIIANSSFSWWGAWLNENPNKLVVAPKKWLQSGAYDTSDLIPRQWLKV